ncbi:hypothetical protein FJ651_07800 [Paucihalobacter ruber]|uniref:DUF998 domain-containing protein n=1 Tax=Paucihalobacter ruber TaxID=2567861 RepID=A0A506PKH6_9FLAO|nr:hypothetical protein [Paucihalobacter ruber]TPV34054.1 hypothetical protein FJ651_07800 [Paucihalobacter ruber]
MSKKYKFIATLIYTLGIFCLLVVFVLGKTYNIPYEKFTGDPAYIYKSNPFNGVISNIGALFWCTTASICLFSGRLLWSFGSKKQAVFLFYSGVFTTILLIDDFFMFHDFAVYYIVKHDFAQYFVLLSYAIFSIWYLLNFYTTIMKENYIFISLAFFFLGTSVIIDIIFESEGLQYLIEDGFKFLGIISWMLFYTIASHRLVLENYKTINQA